MKVLCTNTQLTRLHIPTSLLYAAPNANFRSFNPVANSNEFKKLTQLRSLTLKDVNDTVGDMGSIGEFLRDNATIETLDFASLKVTLSTLDAIVTCPNLQKLAFEYDHAYYAERYNKGAFPSVRKVAKMLIESNLDSNLDLTIYSYDFSRNNAVIAALTARFQNVRTDCRA